MNTLSAYRSANIEKYYWLCDDLFAKWIVEMLKPYGTSIVDVGCGNGFMIPYYVREFENVGAVEPTKFLYKKVINRYRSGNIQIRNSAAESIDFGNNQFDISIAKSSLHHFSSLSKGISEMERISKNVIAIVEVIAPDEICIPFLTDILLRKEKQRVEESIFTEKKLCKLIEKQIPKGRKHSVIFDQYIDVKNWLLYSDLNDEERQVIWNIIFNSNNRVKSSMQIHYRNKRLVMLRRMCLCIALLDDTALH